MMMHSQSKESQSRWNRLYEKYGIAAIFPPRTVTMEELIEGLRETILDCVQNPLTSWLLAPLVEGLYTGRRDILSRTVSMDIPGAAPQTHLRPTLLHWVCQWRLLINQFGWKGSDDIVALVIAAGADVNATQTNGCTPIFFAVKYGTLRTVRLLVESGADLHRSDINGRTCLFNALEHPQPNIIEELLKHLPADEEFGGQEVEESDGRLVERKQTAVPVMLLKFVSTVKDSLTGAPSPLPTSWRVLGMPNIEDYAISIQRFLQHDVAFSRNPSSAQVGWDFLSIYIQGSDMIPDNFRGFIQKIRDMLMGFWLPRELRSELQENEPITPQTDCVICLENMDDTRNPVTLYCGHTFCYNCILEYGASDSSQRKACPTCQRPLCRDAMDDANRLQLRGRNMLGIDSDQPGRIVGPDQLTEEQLHIECRARDLPETAGLREIRATIQSNPSIIRELGATASISNGSVTYIAPKAGCALVPIKVRGIVILAYL